MTDNEKLISNIQQMVMVVCPNQETDSSQNDYL